MKIYLIGMPASGKTSIGKKLSKRLDYIWHDLDQELEEAYQKNINQIVKEEGENSFREKEKSILHRSFAYKKAVISTGGGCPCFFDNLEQMKKNGLIIFLNTNLTRITNRIMRNKEKRFMFKNYTKKELLYKIQDLYEERKKYYLQAHWILNL